MLLKLKISLLTAILTLCLAPLCLAQSPATVLVVANMNNAQSVALANYYMNARKIPASNLLLENWTADDNAYTCTVPEFKSLILQPIIDKVATLTHIDYIVLCRNLPIQVPGTSRSVDSMIAGYTNMTQITNVRMNPYYGQTRPFNSSVYGIHLVTRLDGWSWEDSFGLVLHSITAKGGEPILMVMAQNCSTGAYGYYNSRMAAAAQMLTAKKANVVLANTHVFVQPSTALGGYYSWGSHDSAFRIAGFAQLQFAPGAIAETIYSFSGESIRYPGVKGSQSAILIHAGVTGIKGYTSEPYAGAVANPVIMFPNYVAAGVWWCVVGSGRVNSCRRSSDRVQMLESDDSVV